MPQISPLSWIMMFMMFSSLGLITMMILYTARPFQASLKITNKKILNKQNSW